MNDSPPGFLTKLHERFTKYDDRGLRAGLRKLLSDTTRSQGIVAMGETGFANSIAKPADEAVLGLYALHPKHDEKAGNFGTTCHKLAKNQEDSFIRHFRRLMACRTVEDACTVTARLVRMAKSKDIPVNYNDLRYHLSQWESGWPREKWAKAYFGTRMPDESAGEPSTTDDDE